MLLKSGKSNLTRFSPKRLRSEAIGVHRSSSAVKIFLFLPGPPRKIEPPMNADWFAGFVSFRSRIELCVIDNLFISIELFADGLSRWLTGLRDSTMRAPIAARFQILAPANPGDVRPVGECVSELRIDGGPGYPVYFVQRGAVLIVLL
jgi:putative addiction module killer protein